MEQIIALAYAHPWITIGLMIVTTWAITDIISTIKSKK